MSDIVNVKNIASYLDPLIEIGANTITAPTGTQQLGATINRFKTGGPLYRSAASVVLVKATLAAKKTLTIARAVQDALSTTAWANFGTQPSNVILGSTSSTASQAILTQIVDAIDLSGARQYVRVNITPTFLASVTDTAALASVLVLGGSDHLT